jgi:hypothetical protein
MSPDVDGLHVAVVGAGFAGLAAAGASRRRARRHAVRSRGGRGGRARRIGRQTRVTWVPLLVDAGPSKPSTRSRRSLSRSPRDSGASTPGSSRCSRTPAISRSGRIPHGSRPASPSWALARSRIGGGLDLAPAPLSFWSASTPAATWPGQWTSSIPRPRRRQPDRRPPPAQVAAVSSGQSSDGELTPALSTCVPQVDAARRPRCAGDPLSARDQRSAPSGGRLLRPRWAPARSGRQARGGLPRRGDGRGSRAARWARPGPPARGRRTCDRRRCRRSGRSGGRGPLAAGLEAVRASCSAPAHARRPGRVVGRGGRDARPHAARAPFPRGSGLEPLCDGADGDQASAGATGPASCTARSWPAGSARRRPGPRPPERVVAEAVAASRVLARRRRRRRRGLLRLRAGPGTAREPPLSPRATGSPTYGWPAAGFPGPGVANVLRSGLRAPALADATLSGA